MYDSLKVFDYSPLIAIAFEPTSMIFVGSEIGEMVALSFINEKTHYIYVEMGRKKYCTIKVAKKKTNDKGPRIYDPDS